MIGDCNFIDEFHRHLILKQSSYFSNNLRLASRSGGQLVLPNNTEQRIESYTQYQVHQQQQQNQHHQYQTQEVTVIGADLTNNNDTFDANSTIDSRACYKPEKKVIRSELANVERLCW